jgi:DNA-binding LacI/PurR family transcriptional regulator
VTVRSAIELLVNQGLVVRQQGKRTQVVSGAFVEKTHILLGLTYRSRLGLTHPYVAGIIRGINFAFGDADIDIEMINIHPPALARSGGSPGDLLKDCDGLFLLFPWLDASEIEAVMDSGKPVVSIGVHPDGADIPQAYADERGSYRTVIEHLLNLGHRRIGAVGTSLATYSLAHGCHRTQHLLEELDRYSGEGRLACPPKWNREVPEFTRECGFEAGMELFSPTGDRPTAIIATDDGLALGLIDAAKQLGIRVPEDLSVTGLGNYFETERPRVTTLVFPTFEMGVLAGEAMLAELQGKPQRGLPPFLMDLAIGETTAQVGTGCTAGDVAFGHEEKRSHPVTLGAESIASQGGTAEIDGSGEPGSVQNIGNFTHSRRNER